MNWKGCEIDLSTVESFDDLERQVVIYWVKFCKGDMYNAASILGMGYATVYRKMKRYGIRPRSFNPKGRHERADNNESEGIAG